MKQHQVQTIQTEQKTPKVLESQCLDQGDRRACCDAATEDTAKDGSLTDLSGAILGSRRHASRHTTPGADRGAADPVR